MMKKLVLYFYILLLVSMQASSQVKTVYVTSYGAKPGDNSSDQAAFNSISEVINKAHGNIKVVFPAGKYLVGPKFRYNTSNPVYPLKDINDVFSLLNCNNVSFEGQGKVIISFEDNLPFGIFPDKKGDPAEISANIGSLFRLTGCTNVSFSNISADGNNNKMLLLKNFGIGSNPYEREHEGLFILNSQQIRVKDCSFNYFGRDGCMVLQDADKLPIKDIYFSNCSFNSNGRNGFSWCGGENLQFVSCSFKNNSTGIIKTSPGAGLDIEPERNALCSKGYFAKCVFEKNEGYAVTSGYSTASAVTFDSCRIIGNSNFSLLCISPKFSFINTFIAGTSMFYYDGGELSAATGIRKCTFTDSIAGEKVFILNYLVGITGRNVKLEDCILSGYNTPLAYVEVKSKKIAGRPENVIFESCLLNAFFKKPATWGKNAFIVSNTDFKNCMFKSSGFADFRLVLGEQFRNIYQENNNFIN